MHHPDEDKATDAPPLAGLTVLDWTHVLAGPATSYNLAVLGARVIRVETVAGGDIIRRHSPDAHRAALEMGDAFVMQGAGKESIALDATDDDAKEILRQLISRADILVENFRPGKLAALGFDPQELIRQHPRLIVCSVSGFGQVGPHADRPAYDHVIQAVSGMMACNADDDGTPRRFGSPLVDYATGLQATLAILAALARRHREERAGQPRTRGEWLDVSLHGTAMALLTPAYASYAVSGQERPRSRATAFSGNPLSGTFATRDGHVAIVCNTARQSDALLQALQAAAVPEAELAELQEDVAAVRVDRVHARLAGILGRETSEHWEAQLTPAGVPVAAVMSAAQAYDQASQGPYLWPAVAVPGKADTDVRVPGCGFASNRTLTPPLTPPPHRGQHSAELLEELGMSQAHIAELRQRGVLHASGSRAA